MSPASRCAILLAAVAALATPPAARAHSDISDASGLSMLPVAVSVAAPAVILVGSATLTVAAVEASATGTVWVLERGSDGARMSVRFSGRAAAAVGTAVAVTAIGTGWVISAAGAAIAFVPNEIGRSLLHHERITR